MCLSCVIGEWRVVDGESLSYIGPPLLVRVLEDLVEDVDTRRGLEGDAGEEAAIVDVADELLWAGLCVRVALGALGCRGEGGLVVEAVEVAAGLLELLDPLLWLGDHHVAVEGAAAVLGARGLDVLADLGHDGRAEGDVGHEMAVPSGWNRMVSQRTWRHADQWAAWRRYRE